MIGHIVDLAKKDPKLVKSELPKAIGQILRDQGSPSHAKSLLKTNLDNSIMEPSSALKLLHYVSRYDLNWAKIYLSLYTLKGIVSEKDMYTFRSKMYISNKMFDLAAREIMIASDLYDVTPVKYIPPKIARKEKSIVNMDRVIGILLKYASISRKYEQIPDILDVASYLGVQPTVSTLIHLSRRNVSKGVRKILERDPDIIVRLSDQNVPLESVKSILDTLLTMPYSKAHSMFAEYLLRDSRHSMIEKLASRFEEVEEMQNVYIRSLFRRGEHISAYEYILQHPSIPNIKLGMSYFRWDSKRLRELYKLSKDIDPVNALLHYVSSIEDLSQLLSLKDDLMAIDSEVAYNSYISQLLSIMATYKQYDRDEIVSLVEEFTDYFEYSCSAVSNLLDVYRITNYHSEWFDLYSKFKDSFMGSPRFMTSVFNMQRSKPFMTFDELVSMSDYVSDYLMSIRPLWKQPYSVIYPALSYVRAIYANAENALEFSKAHDVVLDLLEMFEEAGYRDSFIRESTNLLYGNGKFDAILDLIYKYESMFGRSHVTDVYRADVYTELGWLSEAKELLQRYLEGFSSSPYYPTLLYANSVGLSISLYSGEYQEVIDNFELNLKYYLSSIRGHKEIFRAFVDYVLSLNALEKPMDLKKLRRAYYRYHRATPFRYLNKNKVRKVKEILGI